MTNKNNGSQFNWGYGIGLGAVVGVLVSAIVGMLRLSKPKDKRLSAGASLPKAALAEEKAVPQSPAAGLAKGAAQASSTAQVASALQRVILIQQGSSNRWG